VEPGKGLTRKREGPGGSFTLKKIANRQGWDEISSVVAGKGVGGT
jgi:hypothetical protein